MCHVLTLRRVETFTRMSGHLSCALKPYGNQRTHATDVERGDNLTCWIPLKYNIIPSLAWSVGVADSRAVISTVSMVRRRRLTDGPLGAEHLPAQVLRPFGKYGQYRDGAMDVQPVRRLIREAVKLRRTA